MEVKVMKNVLAMNDEAAAENAALFQRKGIFVLNLMGSPGAGKTTLLECTLEALKDEMRIAVIEGDLFTTKDAERIEHLGVPVVQINTSGGCHLDAPMIESALASLDLAALDFLVIENVGNLVCPAEFELGQDKKAVVLSITEGDDKPLKYPRMFKEADAALLNKVDLLPYTDFDMESATEDIRTIHPGIEVMPIACRTGEGLAAWLGVSPEEIERAKRELEMTPAVTVLGIGNVILQDEGFGVRAAELLREKYDFPPEVQIIDGGTLGAELLGVITGTERLLVLDSVNGGKEAGTLFRFENETIAAHFQDKLSVHEVGIQDVLTTLSVTGRAIPDVVVLGAQPYAVGAGVALTPAMEALLPEIERRALEELSRWGIEARPKSEPRGLVFTRVAEAKNETAGAVRELPAQDEADDDRESPLAGASEAMRTAPQILPHELLTKGGEG